MNFYPFLRSTCGLKTKYEKFVPMIVNASFYAHLFTNRFSAHKYAFFSADNKVLEAAKK